MQIRRKAGEGEECIVCGEFIRGGEVVELRMRGRTFYVVDALLEQFLEDPDKYFAKLQARSALFDEVGTDVSLGSWPFWIGIYCLIGLLFSAICGYLAVTAGMPAVPWFFAGLIGNVAALFVLMAAKNRQEATAAPPGLAKVPNTASPLSCPQCASLNHPHASACSGCGAELSPATASEASLVGRERS
ncbi:MAG: hypothetical protein ACYTG5_01140 [Planctomycetota bacterium]